MTAITACGPAPKDYDASAQCHAQGHKPGTQAYADCLNNIKMDRLIEQQQREFEQLQRDRQDQSLRRY